MQTSRNSITQSSLRNGAAVRAGFRYDIDHDQEDAYQGSTRDQRIKDRSRDMRTSNKRAWSTVENRTQH